MVLRNIEENIMGKKTILSLLFVASLFISGISIGQPLRHNEELFKWKTKQEVISVFYDLNVPQIDFAANKVKKALEEWNFRVQLHPLTALTKKHTTRKIVIVKKDDANAIHHCSYKSYETFARIESQGYAIRTFFMPGSHYAMKSAKTIHDNSVDNRLQPETYMIVGGDENGAMYGGIDLARHIQSSGVTKPLHANETAYLKYRGVKFNIPLDEKAPTYFNEFYGTANKLAVRNVWDITFWKTWFDEMASNKYNVLTLWSPHPFTAMLNMEDEYPGIAIQGVSGFDKNETVVKINNWTIDEKIAFWRQVMKYGRDRGFEIYFVTWNVFLSTAKDKHGLTTDPANALTKTYFRKCMKKFLETYPDLAGFGVTAGEAMGELTNDQKEAWVWDTYGVGMKEYAEAHPTRNLVFVHRLLQSDFSTMMKYFKPLNDLPNVRFDISHKYSNAHAHAAAKPTYWDGSSLESQLASYDIKAWLTVRNDDFFFLHWADPQFVRDYVTSFPEVGKYVHGMNIGPDGWVFTREFTSKNPYYQNTNALEIQKTWLMQKIWGEIAYNPSVPDEVFKDNIAVKYPEVSSHELFNAWTKASRAVRLANEQVTGNWSLDFHWWPEFWSQQDNGYYSLRYSRVEPQHGSNLCPFLNSASQGCTGKVSAFTNADNIELLSNEALTTLKKFNAGSNTELMLNMKDIEAMATLGLFNADKFRAIMYDLQGNEVKARDAMGKAYRNWIAYTTIMDGLYRGVSMQRNHSFKNWHDHDADVLKDFVDLGGPDDFNVVNPFPWVYINSPAPADYYIAPANVTVAVNASAGDTSVVSVQLKSNGVAVGTDTSFPYSFELPGLPAGNYTFDVLVTDGRGRTDTYTRNTKVYNRASFNTVPWIEDFSLSDGTASDDGPTSWTSSRPDWTFFAVKKNEFAINGNGMEGVLTTSEIDISKGAVNISLDVRSGGSLESSDYVKLFKIVDGGAEILIDSKTGNQITPTTIEGTASGTKLILKIKSKVSFSDEYYYMDNLSVKYTATSIHERSDVHAPHETQLKQNYPNPFNPTTTIPYQLAEPCQVKIVIYNYLGQQVATLVDKQQSAGHYAVLWNALDNSGKQLASGLYICQLKTNNAVQMKELILLR